jgi:TonB family protein
MSGPIISADWVGRVIDGRFALQEWLGGTVKSGLFRTELQQPIGKKGAIKLIVAEGAEADACLAGWAKTVNLSHPHLMRVFRSGRFHFGSISLVYVVTECAEEVLAQIVPERPLTTEETREMLGPVVDALEYLHGKGFVHGHLKPTNILVVDEHVKISGDTVTPSGGTRNRFQAPSAYDAPELANGVIYPAADVWALGITLVEVLTQRPPLWDRTSNQEPAIPEMPRVFAEIARECLRRDPERRCSLSGIKERLESNTPIAFPAAGRTSEAETPAADEDTEADERSRAGSRKKRQLTVGAAAVVVLAAFALSMLRSHPKENTVPHAVEQSVAPVGQGADVAATQTTEGRTAKGAVTERSMPAVASFARGTIHGTVSVSVRVNVDANGRVTDAAFKSAGPSKYFARTALEAARDWKFKPAVNAGRPVASAWTLYFKFRHEGDQASAIEDTP